MMLGELGLPECFQYFFFVHAPPPSPLAIRARFDSCLARAGNGASLEASESILTPTDVPIVAFINVTSLDATNLRLEWELADPGEATLTGFAIRRSVSGSNVWTSFLELGASAFSHTWSDVLGSTGYYVELLARSSLGNSVTVADYVFTKPYPPAPPVCLVFSSLIQFCVFVFKPKIHIMTIGRLRGRRAASPARVGRIGSACRGGCRRNIRRAAAEARRVRAPHTAPAAEPRLNSERVRIPAANAIALMEWK